MGLVFYSISGIPTLAKAGAIFDAVVAFDARLAILDAAVANDEDLVTSEEKELWACLSAKLRKLYKQRHQVAHFSLIGDIGTAREISPYFTWNKAARNTAKSLSITQIFELSTKFNEASAAVTWFNAVLQHRKTPPERRRPLLAEPPLIPRLRELAAQKKATRQPQHPPSPV